MGSGGKWTWLAGTELPGRTGSSGQKTPGTQQERAADATGDSLGLPINSCELLPGHSQNYLETEFQRTDSVFARWGKGSKRQIILDLGVLGIRFL